MAPEQARDDYLKIDFRTDLYGLGATLYHLLTGVPPHPGDSASGCLEHARQGVVTPPRELNPRLPRALEQIVMKALAADPGQRYATAVEFRTALRRYRLRRWRQMAMAVLALAAVVALGREVWLWSRPVPVPLPVDSRPSPPPPLPALAGDLILRVWSPLEKGIKRGWRVDQPGALPVLPGEQVRLDANLNRPAYVYLVWIDSEGNVASLHPWKDHAFNPLLSPEAPKASVSSPTMANEGWPLEGRGGLETALLLARQEKLPADFNLRTLIGHLRPTRPRYSEDLVVRGFDSGQPPRILTERMTRGLPAAPTQIDDSLAELIEKLRPHFDVIRAVQFTYKGE
jgi:hypothetical protein